MIQEYDMSIFIFMRRIILFILEEHNFHSKRKLDFLNPCLARVTGCSSGDMILIRDNPYSDHGISDPLVLVSIQIRLMVDLQLLETFGASTKKLSPDEIIFQEGTECYFYHQVVSGHVRWVNFTEDDGEFIQEIIGPGESFGEYPLFDGLPYAASAVANEETVIIRLRKDKFLKLLESNPAVQMDFLKMYTSRLRFKTLLLKEISCYGPVHQISTLFDYFKQAKKNICDTCNVVQLTRQQIADMTGLRVETVIRSIRQMKEKGELIIDKGKVLLPSN